MHRFINEDKFVHLCQTLEVTQRFAAHLRQLIHYKVVLICDDSGSMQSRTNYNETRWDELRRFVTTVFSVTEAFEQSPLDVLFLNRGAVMNVQQLAQITEIFAAPPKGWTPIVPILRQVLQHRYEADDAGYRGRLIIICTDGQPTDDRGNVNLAQLKQVLLKERRATDYVTFLACTDDDDAVGYLNEWDVQIPRVDVVDDYRSEKKEVLHAQGQQFPFTYADYVVKVLMGSVVPELDHLDERRRDYGVQTDCTNRAPSARKNDCVVQ